VGGGTDADDPATDDDDVDRGPTSVFSHRLMMAGAIGIGGSLRGQSHRLHAQGVASAFS